MSREVEMSHRTSVRFSRLLTAAVAVLATATAAVAGAAPRRAASAKKPAVGREGPDIYGGYSYTHAGQANLNGWALAGAYPLHGELRLVAELTGHYGSYAGADLGQTAFMAGVRRSWRLWRIDPFAEALAGLARSSTSVAGLSDSSTSWGFALGGGADYPLSDRWAARGLVQLRLLHGGGSWDTDPRLSLGAVYRFGR
jgi:opacity protein-like surface antigen